MKIGEYKKGIVRQNCDHVLIINMAIKRMEQIRKWFAAICFALCASIFWAFVVSAIIRYFANIDQNNTFFFIGLPVAVLIFLYMMTKLKKIVEMI